MTNRHLLPAHNGVHPLVRVMRDKLEESPFALKDVAKRAGYEPKTLRNWWMGRNTPKIQDLEAVFNAMGYQLTAIITDKDHE